MSAILSINIGQRFSRLVVTSLAGKNRYGLLYECLCDCGNTTVVCAAALVRASGGKKSCGCLKTSHRMTNTPEFQAWMGLQRRCYDPHNASYKDYGGRGIEVWSEWKGPRGFQSFYDHVGPRPSAGYSIDRYPNKDGNYEPGNVRWATIEQQNQNKRDNVLLTMNGESLLIKEWSQRVGIKPDTLYWRKRQGWPDVDVLTTPLVIGRRKSKSCAKLMLVVH